MPRSDGPRAVPPRMRSVAMPRRGRIRMPAPRSRPLFYVACLASRSPWLTALRDGRFHCPAAAYGS